jgi:HEPN domain-containing protein
LTKEEHINYWLTNAEKDWQRAERCFRDKDYLFCLFCIHLCMEKICKAHWVKHNQDNIPPKTHNLLLLIGATNLRFENDDLIFLNDLNKFQLEGRYPDYMGDIYKVCTKLYTYQIMEKAKEIKICLIEKLQLKQ